jgi:hypothetical protein
MCSTTLIAMVSKQRQLLRHQRRLLLHQRLHPLLLLRQ